jgi:hypothetical protein
MPRVLQEVTSALEEAGQQVPFTGEAASLEACLGDLHTLDPLAFLPTAFSRWVLAIAQGLRCCMCAVQHRCEWYHGGDCLLSLLRWYCVRDCLSACVCVSSPGCCMPVAGQAVGPQSKTSPPWQ